MEDSDKIITIARRPISEVPILKARLEEAGIDCFVAEESGGALGGYGFGRHNDVRIQIKECDSEKATRILNDFELNPEQQEEKE